MVSNLHTRPTRLQTYSSNLNSFMYYLTGITNTLSLQVLPQRGIRMLALFLEFKWPLYLIQTSVAYQCREAISCKYLNQIEHAQYYPPGTINITCLKLKIFTVFYHVVWHVPNRMLPHPRWLTSYHYHYNIKYHKNRQVMIKTHVGINTPWQLAPSNITICW